MADPTNPDYKPAPYNFTKPKREKFLRYLREKSASIAKAAKAVGWAEQTARNYIVYDPEFGKAVESAIAEGKRNWETQYRQQLKDIASHGEFVFKGVVELDETQCLNEFGDIDPDRVRQAAYRQQKKLKFEAKPPSDLIRIAVANATLPEFKREGKEDPDAVAAREKKLAIAEMVISAFIANAAQNGVALTVDQAMEQILSATPVPQQQIAAAN